MKNILMIGSLFILCLIGFNACNVEGEGSTTEKIKTVTINYVTWYFENEDSSLFAEPLTSNAFIRIKIYIEEDNLITNDIETVESSSQGNTWNFESGEFDLSNTGSISLVLMSSDHVHTIPLSDWTFKINLKNGGSGTYNESFPKPGTNIIDNTITHVYTEDYAGDKTDMLSMIKRGTISICRFLGGLTVHVSYSVVDSMVANAFLLLFDNTGEYIGYSNPAMSWDDPPTPNGNILPSYGFYTDGNTTTMQIEISDFNDRNTELDFNDVDSVILVLTDGAQYTEDFLYDFISYSPLTKLTP